MCLAASAETEKQDSNETKTANMFLYDIEEHQR